VRRQEIIEEFDESGQKTGRHAGSNADQIRAVGHTRLWLSMHTHCAFQLHYQTKVIAGFPATIQANRQ